MRIKKLELVGFKSFKDRTVIHFDAGITGIVGPNGCGKSNIVDALVWAMGEQSAKHLRGSSMEDVIFAGAEGYAPMGLAEVSLVLENDGGPFPIQYHKYSEIMVTRRLHRDGEAEYLINKEPARLRDIQEIFMDTGAGAKGFSIIQQNAIGQIITSKPDERRYLIEEAAGITKFKARKRESERKLQATEQNLVRLHDIVGELRRQMDSLERQAEKAERYRVIRRETEELDLWISGYHFEEWRGKRRTAEEQYRQFESTWAEIQAQVAAKEAEVASLRFELTQKITDVDERVRLTQKQESSVVEIEGSLRTIRAEIESATRSREMSDSILEEVIQRRDVLGGEVRESQSELASGRLLLEEAEAAFREEKISYDVEAKRVEEVDKTLTGARREFLTLNQAEAQIQAKVHAASEAIESLTDRLSTAEEVLSDLRERQAEAEFALTEAEVARNETESRGQMLTEAVAEFTARRNQAEKAVQTHGRDVEVLGKELADVSGRLYALENLAQSFEGFEEGVKSVLLWQRERASGGGKDLEAADRYVPLSDLVDVPREFETAMTFFLGARLQALVASSDQAAQEGLQFLKDAAKGRSGFVLSSRTAGEEEALEKARPPVERVRAYLSDVVRLDQDLAPQVRHFFRQVAVVETIADAIELRAQYPEWTFVTVDGDVIDRDGVMTGGSGGGANQASVLSRRREMRELTESRDLLAEKLRLAEEGLAAAKDEMSLAVRELEEKNRAKSEADAHLVQLGKDLDRARRELAQAGQAVERQDRETRSLSQQKEAKEDDLATLEEKRVELVERRVELESTVENLAQSFDEARSQMTALQERMSELRADVAARAAQLNSIENKVRLVSTNLSDVESQISKMSQESMRNQDLARRGEEAEARERLKLEQTIQLVEVSRSELARARDDYERASTRLNELQNEASQAGSRSAHQQAEIGRLTLEIEQAKLREASLSEQVRERYLLELEAVAERYREKGEPPLDSEHRLRELRERVARMGDVNLSAIDEFKKVSERYEFLHKQQQDLLEAKDQLHRVIDRINRVCATRFRETFEQINGRFRKVFPVLFGGGEAELLLVEDAEKGEMGIDIIARPPGKKLQNMSLLSGGEKALTAVSLVFSIFLVRPSPYCLLDEVDAPLDDANVFRFNDLVREMAKRSQIILVTHNKHTMDVASRLYGVTMEEKGVSKMVSVDLNRPKPKADRPLDVEAMTM